MDLQFSGLRFCFISRRHRSFFILLVWRSFAFIRSVGFYGGSKPFFIIFIKHISSVSVRGTTSFASLICCTNSWETSFTSFCFYRLHIRQFWPFCSEIDSLESGLLSLPCSQSTRPSLRSFQLWQTYRFWQIIKCLFSFWYLWVLVCSLNYFYVIHTKLFVQLFDLFHMLFFICIFHFQENLSVILLLFLDSFGELAALSLAFDVLYTNFINLLLMDSWSFWYSLVPLFPDFMEALRLNFAWFGILSDFQKLFVIALGCHLCIFIKR